MISTAIVEWLEEEAGITVLPETGHSVSGGCINEAKIVERADGGSVFLKFNRIDRLDLFEAEKACLDLMAKGGAIRVPEPYALGTVDASAVFAIEGLDLRSGGGPGSQEVLAEQLAALHDTLSPNGKFGADFDNFIGATPQPNAWTESWADFYTEHRLDFQFHLASKRGHTFQEAKAVKEAVHVHLSGLEIQPSLLHGDLWGGNVSFLADGTPVLYDPACYFGDREADMAFTRMFGGFGPPFYRRYREQCPEPEPIRETIYNLYHLLNHYNLFGGGYASQAESSIREILRKLP